MPCLKKETQLNRLISLDHLLARHYIFLSNANIFSFVVVVGLVSFGSPAGWFEVESNCQRFFTRDRSEPFIDVPHGFFVFLWFVVEL